MKKKDGRGRPPGSKNKVHGGPKDIEVVEESKKFGSGTDSKIADADKEIGKTAKSVESIKTKQQDFEVSISKSKNFVCDTCDIPFVELSDLYSHEKQFHYIKCDFCDITSMPSIIKSHIKREHHRKKSHFKKDVDLISRKNDPNILKLTSRKSNRKEQQQFALKKHIKEVPKLADGDVKTGDKGVIKKCIHEMTKKTSLKCNICKTSLKTKHALNKHIYKIHSKFKYICEFCNSAFSKDKRLRPHFENYCQKKEIKKVKDFECKYCKQAFYQHRKIREIDFTKKISQYTKIEFTKKLKDIKCKEKEEKDAITSPTKCKLCRKKFNSMGNMKRHVRMVHENSIHFKCQYCDQTFKEDRIQKFHNGKVKNKCTFCPFISCTEHGLSRHIKKNHQQQQKQCDVVISNQKDFEKHSKVKHEQSESTTGPVKEKVETCTECPFQSFHKIELEKHIKKVHGLTEFKGNDVTNQEKDEQGIKKVAENNDDKEVINCHLCDIVLDNQFSLLSHYQKDHPSAYTAGREADVTNVPNDKNVPNITTVKYDENVTNVPNVTNDKNVTSLTKDDMETNVTNNTSVVVAPDLNPNVECLNSNYSGYKEKNQKFLKPHK